MFSTSYPATSSVRVVASAWYGTQILRGSGEEGLADRWPDRRMSICELDVYPEGSRSAAL